jgi:hypothetical protein
MQIDIVFLTELKFPCVYPRQIENIVDDIEQVAAALQHEFCVFALLRRRCSSKTLIDHFRKADDRVQRRGQFMADISQKLGLGDVGGFGGFLSVA